MNQQGTSGDQVKLRSATPDGGTSASVKADAAAPTGPEVPAVPDYELFQRIGAGAYGEVWLARNIATGTLRAAKIIRRATFADERPFNREFEGIKKFEAVSRSHPSQLAIFHVGRNDAARCFYYVMELADDAEAAGEKVGKWVSGNDADGSRSESAPINPHTYTPKTLRSLLLPPAHSPTGPPANQTRLPAARVLEIGLALTEALAHLHGQGLVHRDIKPSNIIFVDGRPKLADIGLVTDASDTRSIVGTEGYLPPEGPGTPAADLFALGKLLYEALTGLDRRQYPDLPAQLREWPDRALVFELNEILVKACAADVRQRYASAEVMLADLQLLNVGKSVKRRRSLERGWEWTWKAAVAISLFGLASLFLQTELARVKTSAEKGNADTFENSGTTNREAFLLYVQARECMKNRSGEMYLSAIQRFEEAVSKDPKFARGWAGLATVYSWLDNSEDTAPRICRPKSREAALKALALDNSLAEAHVALGTYKMFFEWDWVGAERELTNALALDPGAARPRSVYADLLSITGRHDDAIREARLALELNPDALGLNSSIGIFLFRAGRKEEAAEQIRKALAINRNDANAIYQLAKVLWTLGHHVEAMSEFDRFHVLYSGSTGIEGTAHEAFKNAGGGQVGLAAYCRVCLDDLEASERNRKPDQWNPPMNWVWFYTIAGDLDNAFKWWERAGEERQPLAVSAVVDPFFERLWADPRFDDILRRVGLDSYFPERMHPPQGGEMAR